MGRGIEKDGPWVQGLRGRRRRKGPIRFRTMQVNDLTERFIEHVMERQDEERYEACFPELFEHYFRFFGPGRGYPSDLTTAAIRACRDRIQRQLPDMVNRFAQAGWDLDPLEVVLFVGQDCSNGHALLQENRVIVWLPVETYRSSLAVQFFVSHEILHALHYQRAPSFWFEEMEARNHLGRQLLTEGVATLVTKELLGVDDTTALWADCVPRDWAEAWVLRRKFHLRGLAEYAQKRFDTSSRDNGFFWYTGDLDEDVYQNRAGYFLGLETVRAIRDELGLTAKGLLKMARKPMESHAKNLLQRMMGNQQPAGAVA